MLNYVLDFFRGSVRRRTLLWGLLPLIFIAYFGTLGLAIWAVPGSFDWRYRSVSKLLYLRTAPELPALHLIVSIDVAVAGLLMIPFAGYIGRRLRSISPIIAGIGAAAFGAGAVLLIFAAMIVSQPDGGSSRGLTPHELLARLCGFVLGIGMLAFYVCAARSRAGATLEANSDSRLIIAWSAIVPPALLIASLRGLAALRLDWSDPVYRALQSRTLWHLGFWEWIGSGAVFLFLLSAALFLPQLEQGSSGN